MTEDQARQQIAARVPRETFCLLEKYVELLIDEAATQNLISAATVPSIWQRHILDSVQLLDIDDGNGEWTDIGAGAGLPGIVVAIASGRPVTLIEPRALRIGFLRTVKDRLDLENVTLVATKAQRASPRAAAVVSARAVASLTDIFAMAQHLATAKTRWILPRGRSAVADVASAEQLWQASFHQVPSVTDSQAAIVVATHVRPRKRR